MSTSDDRRERLIRACRVVADSGLTAGRSGNLSLRLDDGFLITPSGARCGSVTADALVVMPGTGEPAREARPSTEWRFHRDLYAARPDVHAVVHAHPPFCTALACARRRIPPFHYMVAVAGGTDIRCAPYATFGTQALSDHVLEALDGRRACLLANHGMVATGADPETAVELALEVENLAQQYWRTLQAGEPVLLTDREMQDVLERFRTYRP